MRIVLLAASALAFAACGDNKPAEPAAPRRRPPKRRWLATTWRAWTTP